MNDQYQPPTTATATATGSIVEYLVTTQQTEQSE